MGLWLYDSNTRRGHRPSRKVIMSDILQKRCDLTNRIFSWAADDGTLGGLRRLMIGNSRWTGSREVTVSIVRHTDELRICFSKTEVRIPKEGYSHVVALDTVRVLRKRIYPDWDLPISSDEVAGQVQLLKRAWGA